MQTQKKVPTPMSRIKVQMIAIRKEMARLGFNRISLNQSDGSDYQHLTTKIVKNDYVEFFSTTNVKLTDEENKRIEDNYRLKRFNTWGFSFSYINLEKDEQTVKIQYQEREREYGYTNHSPNKTLKNEETEMVNISVLLEYLPAIVLFIKNTQNIDEFFQFIRGIILSINNSTKR